MELGRSAFTVPPGLCDLVAGSLWRRFVLWSQVELSSNLNSTNFMMCDTGPAISFFESRLPKVGKA